MALGFETCCVADFQIGRAWWFGSGAGLETGDTADLEVCASALEMERTQEDGSSSLVELNASN